MPIFPLVLCIILHACNQSPRLAPGEPPPSSREPPHPVYETPIGPLPQRSPPSNPHGSDRGTARPEGAKTLIVPHIYIFNGGCESLHYHKNQLQHIILQWPEGRGVTGYAHGLIQPTIPHHVLGEEYLKWLSYLYVVVPLFKKRN